MVSTITLTEADMKGIGLMKSSVGDRIRSLLSFLVRTIFAGPKMARLSLLITTFFPKNFSVLQKSRERLRVLIWIVLKPLGKN
jgi:hypothetical protein